MLKKRKRKKRGRKYPSIKRYRKNYYRTISIAREIETPFDLTFEMVSTHLFWVGFSQKDCLFFLLDS